MRRLLPLIALLAACTPDETPAPQPPKILEVDATESWTLPGLACDAHVVRTEMDVPHVYARDKVDAARVLGFTYARDRFFTLDMARRLSQGRLSELLGDKGLGQDVEARVQGMVDVVDALEVAMPADLEARLTAYAEGVNAYIDAVKAGKLPVPSELQLAGGLLGASDPTELMAPFTTRDVIGVLGTLVFQLGWDTSDVDRAAAAEAAAAAYADGEPFADERRAGLVTDVVGGVAPISTLTSAPGFVVEPAASSTATSGHAPRVPGLAALAARLGRVAERLGVPVGTDRGSNAWAVMGQHTADGRALLSGDGHLPLSVPSLFWQMGVDTAVLGGEAWTQAGLGLPGVPMIAVGTNGHVAWSQTRLMGDITDWYAEELKLGAGGLPAASRFQGAWRDLVATTDTITVRSVPILGSVGRSEAVTRWSTFDGRRLVWIEGEPVEAPGEGVVRLPEGLVRVGDVDGDEVIAGVSVDFTSFDPNGLVLGLDGFGTATDVDGVREATRHLVGYGQNIVAADADGSVFYTGYQAVPCRASLLRDGLGWAPGSDPRQLLDGTVHPGFSIGVDDQLRVVEGDPQRCVVPADAIPTAKDPAQGWLANANEDPGGHGLDGSLANDRWYLGGPWDTGQRKRRIAERLDALVASGGVDVAAMQELQADHQDGLARDLLPFLLDALGRAGDDGLPDDPRFDEVAARLAAWSDADLLAPLGIETAYSTPVAGDAEDAVATMIFNAWLGRAVAGVFGDEPITPTMWQPGRSDGTTRTLLRMLEARDGRGEVASTVASTGESAFFDVLGTEAVERSDEVLLTAMVDALDWLASPEVDPGVGGFGTADMDAWKWGLRHQVRFDSILAEFLGDDPVLGTIADVFAITPRTFSPGPGLDAFPHFPRAGSNESPDQSGHGFGTTEFTYDHGPAFRMVIALGPDGVSGANILPGGQSALTDDPNFADQALLWLGNHAIPLRWSVDDVVAGAVGREVFAGAGGACAAE